MTKARVDQLIEIVLAAPWRRAVLEAVAALDLPDCWVGAGFVRAPLWDSLHGFAKSTPLPDIDIVYFDPMDTSTERETESERRLLKSGPTLPWPDTWWSVRNQARMHLFNNDTPYRNTGDAITHWPETPTAVAIRLNFDGEAEVLAPFGVADLFDMIVRPTPHAREHRMAAYCERMARKDWASRWPKINMIDD